MRTLKHNSLGECEVLLEVMSGDKHFYLIKQRVKRIKDTYRFCVTLIPGYDVPAYPWEKATTHYYCLWGNTNDPDLMGTTKLITPKGKSVKNPNKRFMEIINASTNMQFLK